MRSFSHYFLDKDLETFETAMSVIALNGHPERPTYTFIVNCDPTGDVLSLCNGEKGS